MASIATAATAVSLNVFMGISPFEDGPAEYRAGTSREST
jgi:hypothetical protein